MPFAGSMGVAPSPPYERVERLGARRSGQHCVHSTAGLNGLEVALLLLYLYCTCVVNIAYLCTIASAIHAMVTTEQDFFLCC